MSPFVHSSASLAMLPTSASSSVVLFPTSAFTALRVTPGSRVFVIGAGAAAAAAGRALPGGGGATTARRLPRCTTGDGGQEPSDGGEDTFSRALDAALEDARHALTCTAVVVHGDHALVGSVSATVLESQDLLAAMAKGVFPGPDLDVYKEVSRVAVDFAAVESQCQGGFVTAEGLLAAMDGLRQLTQIVVGGEAAAQLRPGRARPTLPLSTQEDKSNLLWDLAQDLDALVVEAKFRYEKASPAAVHASGFGVVKHQFVCVIGNRSLLDHLNDTAQDAHALLARLLANAADGPFPITDDGIFEELVDIGKAFIKVEAESTQGYATADTVVGGMNALKKMAIVFVGTGKAAGLRPYNPWPGVDLSGQDDKVSYMWDLATAFGVLFHDVKFRCGEFY